MGEDLALRMRHGQAIVLDSFPPECNGSEELVRVLFTQGAGLVAVGRLKKAQKGLWLSPLRVFHDGAFTKKPPCGRDKPKDANG